MESKSVIQKNLFKETYRIMILEELSNIGAGFIDGLVVSNFLGSMAMAAEGITHPYFSIVGLFSGMMMLGTQKLCIDFLGKGDKKKADSVFSTAVIASVVISLILTAVLFIFSGPVV